MQEMADLRREETAGLGRVLAAYILADNTGDARLLREARRRSRDYISGLTNGMLEVQRATDLAVREFGLPRSERDLIRAAARRDYAENPHPVAGSHGSGSHGSGSHGSGSHGSDSDMPEE
jgi:hypothetical protein